MNRPALLLVVGIVSGGLVWTAGPLTQPSEPPVAEAVEAVGMTVEAMERSVGFYSTTTGGFAAGLLVRGPDGHAMRLIER
jgi:hypothetical protein